MEQDKKINPRKIFYTKGDSIGVFKFVEELPAQNNGHHRVISVECAAGHITFIDLNSAKGGTKCRECRPKRIGKTINSWTILRKSERVYQVKDGQKIILYDVRCECGHETVSSLSNLKMAGCKNCKRNRGKAGWKELTGERYDHFRVIGPVEYPVVMRSNYNCICDCDTEFVACRRDILAGDVQSCGCIRRRNEIQSIINRAYRQHLTDAHKRKYHSELTVDDYETLGCQPCVGCGGYYVRTNKDTGATKELNTVDRRDNEPYYTLSNAQPMCVVCQRFKSNMKHAEFEAHITKLIEFRKKSNT